MRNDLAFPPELRTAAFVPRWSIVWTLNRDTVASHSFYVALYSYLIAETLGWDGPRDYVMLRALTHDVDETITGDIVGPVKSRIVDQERAEDFVNPFMLSRMGFLVNALYACEDGLSPIQVDEADRIVHAADKLDALLHLMVDKRMGNSVIDKVIEKGKLALEGAWRGLPGDPAMLSATWQTVVLPSISAHATEGGCGV